MKIEEFKINYNHVISSENIMFHSGTMNGPMMSPWFNLDSGSEMMRSDPGHDYPFGPNHLMAIGDLIIVSTHGSGIRFHRLANTGAITYIAGESTMVGADYHGISFAYHAPTKRLYVGADGLNGIQEVDITDLVNGGTTYTKERFVVKGTINTDTVGNNYAQGLAFAGDWLYYSGDSSDITQQGRWNVVTDTHEVLDVVNKYENMDSGRNITYDPISDRIFVQGFYNGQIWCTVNASTAGAVTYQIRYDWLGVGNDGYGRGLIVIDKNNSNYIFFESNDRYVKIDITNAITGVDMNCPFSPDWSSVKSSNWHDLGLAGHYRMGTLNPDFGSDFIQVMGNDGWCRKGGWVDQETGNIITHPRNTFLHQSRDYMEYDYMAVPVRATLPDSTPVWVHGGYGGGEGHQFNVYSDTDGKYKLMESANCIVGTYQFSDLSIIQACQLPNLDKYLNEPSGTSLIIQVSNDNGVTWENYIENSNNIHVFQSTGNQVRIKYLFSGGSGKKAAYLYGKDSSGGDFYNFKVTLINDLPDLTKKIRIARYRGLRRRR